jgi:hypothetical protein
MGKVDQGVFTFWVLSHRLGRPCGTSLRGAGSKGMIFHIDDAVDLIERQLQPNEWAGFTGNVGGAGSAARWSRRLISAVS